MLRKSGFGVGVLLLLFLSSQPPSYRDTSKKRTGICVGYSIIEFGKGVDCHGDTIRLIKKDGLQVFIAGFEHHQKD